MRRRNGVNLVQRPELQLMPQPKDFRLWENHKHYHFRLTPSNDSANTLSFAKYFSKITAPMHQPVKIPVLGKSHTQP